MLTLGFDPGYSDASQDILQENRRPLVYPDGTTWEMYAVFNTLADLQAAYFAYFSGQADPFLGHSWHLMQAYRRKERGRYVTPAFGLFIEGTRPPRGADSGLVDMELPVDPE